MEWNASAYEAHHGFVWRQGLDLVDWLAPQPGERILDVGCGTGQLTHEIARRGAIVEGLDLSPTMLEAARSSYPDIRFLEGDLLTFQADQPYDAVFSNAALHWILPPEAAMERIRAALRPGGRLVAEFGGNGNISGLLQAIEAVAPASVLLAKELWYFPSAREYKDLAKCAAMEVEFCEEFDRPTELEEGRSGLRRWIEMFGGSAFSGLDATQIEEVEAQAEEGLWKKDTWRLDYRRLRVVARRPER